MATKQRYFPKTEAAQADWLLNFRTKLPAHGPACGLATPEITATTDEITAYLYVYNWHSALRADLHEATAFKKYLAQGAGSAATVPASTVLGTPPPATLPGIFQRIFAQVQRMKNHSGYTEAIGQDLQIIGAENTVSHTTPEFSLAVEDSLPNQKVVVKFRKFEHEGVQIEMRRPQFSAPWIALGVDTKTPFEDDQNLQAGNQPETREYRLRFWDRGEPNGEYSAVQSVTVR